MARPAAKPKPIRFSVHPKAKLVPGMNTEEYTALKSDIEKNGLIEPIWVIGNQIIDGRHRYKACLELKIEPAFREYKGTLDVETFILAANVSRRQLTRHQRTYFIKLLLKSHPENSDRSIAAMVGVHNETVGAIRASDGIRQLTKRMGADGRLRHLPKAPEITHRATSLVTKADFASRRILQFLSELHPDELTDFNHFIAQCEAQLERLRSIFNRSTTAGDDDAGLTAQ